MTSRKSKGELLASSSLVFGALALLYASLVLLVLFPPVQDPLLLALVKLFTGILIFGGTGIALSRKFKVDLKLSSAKKLGSPVVIAVRGLTLFLAGAAFVVIWREVASQLTWARDRDWVSFSVATKDGIYWMTMVWFLHALAEELFFRGFVFNHLRRFFSLPTAVAISSALFSIAHLPVPSKMIFLFLSAVAFALIYVRFGSLIYPVIMHAGVNIIAHFYVVYGNPFQLAARPIILLSLLFFVLTAVNYDVTARKKLGVLAPS